ncbi:MAG: crotonase/enoyl-CoA hydratase family protein [Acidobacteriota bacterium]|nr:crotonase/enoyl-CoA hydratase family protein [Acidobacteriota bacterium]
MAFTSEVITLQSDGPVVTLWLDRPEKRNALGDAFWRDLGLAAREIADDNDVRVVVLAARGPHFTVGLDLKEFSGPRESRATSAAAQNAARYHKVREWQGSVSALAALPVPVIAAVHGYCLGAGIDLITACDIRLCSSDSVFSVRETKVAIVADLGTLQRLPRVVGAGHAAELALTGKDIDAARAEAIGLVNAVRGEHAGAVLGAAYELAGEIAANSPLAVRGTKAVLAANDGRTVEEGLEFVARWNTMYLESNDLREALTAFLERRAPRFSGS